MTCHLRRCITHAKAAGAKFGIPPCCHSCSACGAVCDWQQLNGIGATESVNTALQTPRYRKGSPIVDNCRGCANKISSIDIGRQGNGYT